MQRNKHSARPLSGFRERWREPPRPGRGSPGWKNIDISMRGVCLGPSSSSRFPGGELQSSVPAAELHTQGAAAARCCNRRVSLAMWLHFVRLPPRPPPPTSAPFSGLWRLPSLPRRGAGRPRPAEAPQRRGREPASLRGAGRGAAAGDPAAAAALAGRGEEAPLPA